MGIAINRHNAEIERREQQDGELQIIVSKISSLLHEIESCKNKTKRKASVTKTLKLLGGLEVRGQQTIVKNFDDLKSRLKIFEKPADALDHLDKADKYYFFKDKKREQRYLLDALYHLKINHVTKRQFRVLQMKSEITGDIWDAAYLMKRLLSTGYKLKKRSTYTDQI